MLLAHTVCWSLPLLAAEPIRSDPFADLGLELRAAQEATITKKTLQLSDRTEMRTRVPQRQRLRRRRERTRELQLHDE